MNAQTYLGHQHRAHRVHSGELQQGSPECTHHRSTSTYTTSSRRRQLSCYNKSCGAGAGAQI